jgi:hypothetical protein
LRRSDGQCLHRKRRNDRRYERAATDQPAQHLALRLIEALKGLAHMWILFSRSFL